MHGLQFMATTRRTSSLDIVSLGRILRERDTVDDRLSLRVKLALCHLIRADEERKDATRIGSNYCP